MAHSSDLPTLNSVRVSWDCLSSSANQELVLVLIMQDALPKHALPGTERRTIFD